MENIADKSVILEGFQKSLGFNIFSEKILSELIECVEVEKYDNGKKIAKQGDNSKRAFYIVKKGKVDTFVDNKLLKSYNISESFGDATFINNTPYPSSAQANGAVELYCLTWKDKFSSLFSPYFLEYFKRKIGIIDDKLELKDLEFICTLGKGTYGLVHLSRSKKTKCLYAVKSISKLQIFYDQIAKAVDFERDTLKNLDSPFIMKIVKGLKNNKFIFFVMEYIRGKDLFEVVREIGLLNQFQIQFYIGSVLLAVELLHSKKIIHRDLKPENIMVLENVSV